MKGPEPKKQTSPVKAKSKKAAQMAAPVLASHPYSDSKIVTMVKQGKVMKDKSEVKAVKSKSKLKTSPKKQAPNVYDSDQNAYSEVPSQKKGQRDEGRNGSMSR